MDGNQSEVTHLWHYLSGLGSLSLIVEPVWERASGHGHYALCSGADGIHSVVPGSELGVKGFGFVKEAIKLPFPVEPSTTEPPQGTLNGCRLTLTWRVPVNPFRSSFDMSDGRTLKPSLPIGCRRCSTPLPPFSPTDHFQSLPSEYWAELVDFWSCHRQEFAGITHSLPDDLCIVPSRPGLVYHTDHYALVYLESPSLHTDILECPQCSFKYGMNVRDQQVYRIPFSRTTLWTATLEQDVMHRMHGLQSAHSSFVFRIAALDSPSASFTIRLVNWTSQIATESGKSMHDAYIVSWEDTHYHGDAEVLMYFQEEVLQLERILRERTLMKPLTYLFMGEE